MCTFKSQAAKLNIAIYLVLGLSFQACNDSTIDSNPQEDDAQISNQFRAGIPTGTLAIADLDEASGLANSRSNPNLLWSHNDSGGQPRLFLFEPNGAEVRRYNLTGASNIDWEDMAIGVGPVDNENYIYVADIGDNRAERESLSIYRFLEPDVNQLNLNAEENIQSFETIDFVYEDGPRDAEALMVDPETKHVYIVTKREPSVILYKLAFPQLTTEVDTARRVRVLSYTFATAADISPDGNEVLIKNYLNVYYWKKEANESFEELMAQPPLRLNYAQEPQGEAIAWKVDQSGYYTISELGNADNVQVMEYERN